MVIESKTSDKEQVKNKTVLLFSGGQDSVMFNHLLKPDVLLYIKSGNSYEKQEIKCIKDLCRKGHIDKNKLVIINDMINLESIERKDYIVPNRNAFFILIASLYGEKIYLCSVEGDRSFDKDRLFYTLMTKLLDHMHDEQHWTEKRVFNIISPFKNKTKTMLVKKYLEQNGNSNALLVSYSCYEGKDKPCGWCKACFRKWVSLVNNNIKIPENYFIHNPQKAPWLPELKDRIMSGTWREGREDTDITNALKTVGEW